MTRKKVRLAFISDDSARKATYKKRKKGIIKKVSELTILCGIPACAIISNPFDSKTEVWPDLAGAKQIIERYQNSSVINGAKNVNQESFLLQRITKAREQLKKLKHDNHEKEMTIRMVECMRNKKLPDDISISDLKEFDKISEKNLKEIENKIVDLHLSN
jgi:ribosomal protein S15P/S13E